jgi:hypothetical protein
MPVTPMQAGAGANGPSRRPLIDLRPERTRTRCAVRCKHLGHRWYQALPATREACHGGSRGCRRPEHHVAPLNASYENWAVAAATLKTLPRDSPVETVSVT